MRPIQTVFLLNQNAHFGNCLWLLAGSSFSRRSRSWRVASYHGCWNEVDYRCFANGPWSTMIAFGAAENGRRPTSPSVFESRRYIDVPFLQCRAAPLVWLESNPTICPVAKTKWKRSWPALTTPRPPSQPEAGLRTARCQGFEIRRLGISAVSKKEPFCFCTFLIKRLGGDSVSVACWHYWN